MRDTHAQELDRVQRPQTYLSTRGGNEMIPKHVETWGQRTLLRETKESLNLSVPSLR